MEMNKNIVMLLLLIGFMVLEPIPNELIYNSISGRVIILALVIFFTINHTILGLLATIILLSSLQISAKRQGFRNKLVSKDMIMSGGDRLTVEDLIRSQNICNIDNLKNTNTTTNPFNTESNVGSDL
tara:strand:+ start:333 stop:713 length:381 start_codon:yes stop_codon:yes gene_type:complete